ncbi:MAG: endolytic transglycosylase MltG [Anaerolineae bacterium]|nr:endolytic transglycosylase MltG [Caldilineales bacterium]MDW8269215.1 endolytic transglycosylase MltG [Anaerolineae bacterium]
MSLLRFLPRAVFFLTVVVALGLVGRTAAEWTRAQVTAYEREGADAGLVRFVDAPWRTLRPDNLETQVLQFYLNLRRSDIERPVDPNGAPVAFHVEFGETGFEISERLENLGLIRDAALFRLYMRLNGIDQQLEAGDFLLSPAMTMPEIAEALQSARAEDILVRIPEGRRAEEVAQILEENGVVGAAEFLASVRAGDLALLGLPDYPLLRDKPAGLSFEGYLFPDTYRFPVAATSAQVLRIFFDNLEARVDDNLRQQIAASGLTFHQVLTLASIVEREAALAEERPLIASTYRNRLGETCARETFGYLQADPTAQYAMGYSIEQQTWWPTVEKVEDYQQFNSPYNTYLYPGLPPGPIASPSLASIVAVVNPAETNYCYFVASSGGAHVFAETGAEHQLNVQTYGR